MPEIPDSLLDADELSRVVYNYWIALLRTDNAVEQDAANWTDLEDVFKEDFTESIRIHVINLLTPIFEKIERDDYISSHSPDINKSHRCYTCDRAAVAFAGDVCATCSYSYLDKNQ